MDRRLNSFVSLPLLNLTVYKGNTSMFRIMMVVSARRAGLPVSKNGVKIFYFYFFVTENTCTLNLPVPLSVDVSDKDVY